VIEQGGTEAKTFVQEGGIRREKYDFQPYVYTFAEPSTLLDLVSEETLRAKPQVGEERETHQWKFGKDELDSIGQLKINKEPKSTGNGEGLQT